MLITGVNFYDIISISFNINENYLLYILHNEEINYETQ